MAYGPTSSQAPGWARCGPGTRSESPAACGHQHHRDHDHRRAGQRHQASDGGVQAGQVTAGQSLGRDQRAPQVVRQRPARLADQGRAPPDGGRHPTISSPAVASSGNSRRASHDPAAAGWSQVIDPRHPVSGRSIVSSPRPAARPVTGRHRARTVGTAAGCPGQDGSMPELREIVALVEQSLGEPDLDAAELARRACLSRFHFDRLASAALGEPPGAFRRRLAGAGRAPAGVHQPDRDPDRHQGRLHRVRRLHPCLRAGLRGHPVGLPAPASRAARPARRQRHPLPPAGRPAAARPAQERRHGRTDPDV